MKKIYLVLIYLSIILINFEIKIKADSSTKNLFFDKIENINKLDLQKIYKKSIYNFKFLLPKKYTHINNANFLDILQASSIDSKTQKIASNFKNQLKKVKGFVCLGLLN